MKDFFSNNPEEKDKQLKLVEEFELKLDQIATPEQCIQLCQEFVKLTPHDVPIRIKDNHGVTEQMVAKMKEFQFPKDFIDYYEKYNALDVTLWGVRLNFVFLHDTWTNYQYRDFLYEDNGFYVMESDGGGNLYVYQSETQKIFLADHNEVITDIKDLYMEIYDFWIDENGVVQNPQELDLNLIYDENKQFIETSKYIKNHFEESMQETDFKTFGELFKHFIKDALATIKSRYLS